MGRPDDGTDTGGFGNTEYFVDLKPHDEWRPVFHRNKEELIAAMNLAAQKYPGAIWNFSQPIEDNVGETMTGTKGSLALKIFGDDLKLLEQKGEEANRGHVGQSPVTCTTFSCCAISVSRTSISLLTANRRPGLEST